MKALLALAFFFALASAQINAFRGDVVVTNDPNVRGIMEGKIFWTRDKFLKFEWSVGVSQVFDYANNVAYKRCSACESSTYNEKPLEFANGGSFTSNGNTKVVDGVTCNGFTSSGQIRTLWLRSNGVPCQAIQAGGKTYTFSNVNTGVPSGTYDVGSWRCPTKTCKLPADVVVVVDKSGSISNSQWADATRFVKNFAASFGGFRTQAYYNANPNLAVRMGLVWFDEWASIKTRLTPDRTSFNNAANANRGGGGWTNIGDGVKKGLDILYGNGNRNVDKFIIFLTDGANTRDHTPLTAQLNRIDDFTAASNRKFTSFAVGVGTGNQLNENVLVRLAGRNRNRYIPVGSYAQLANKLDDLLSKTCLDTNDSPCNCKGFCACDGKCLCPSSCPKGKCQEATCRNANNGCDAPTPRVCTTTNKCKEPFCNSAVGDEGTCDTRDKVCPSNSCALATCNPATGCGLDRNLSKICTGFVQGCTTCDSTLSAPNQCTTDTACKCAQTNCDSTVRGCKYQSCNPDTGNCEEVDVECDDGNPCTDDTCDASGLGVCEFKPRVCSDNNLCTDDTCDSATPDGCVFTPKNVTLECDDFSVCTNDTCVPDKGCVNEIIPCVSVNGTDPCLNTSCDAIMGCVTNPTDCYAANANISLLIGDCQTVQCNQTAGCYLEPIDGAEIDDCGVCKGQERPFFCNKGAVAGIAVGVIAGATVGGVAGAAALGFGAKKGYDFFSERNAAAGGVQNNPLYVDNNANNHNPLFNG